MNNTDINSKLLALLETIPQITEDSTPQEWKILLQAFHESIQGAIALKVSNELQLFASNYAAWTFIIQRNPEYVPASKAYSIIRRKVKQQELNFKDVQECYDLTVFIISCLADCAQDLPHKFVNPTSTTHEQVLPFLRAFVQTITKIHDNESDIEYHVQCRDEHDNQCILILTGHIALSARYVWIGATIHVFSLLSSYDSDTVVYYTTPESLFVIEPDILISATDIAECSQYTSTLSVAPYFLKRFFDKKPSTAMLTGIIAGNFLDELIVKGEKANLVDIIQTTLTDKPLQTLVTLQDEHDEEFILEQSSLFAALLKQEISAIDGDIISTEAAFLSPLFGINGRLDVLLEYEDDPLRKTVIELKTGSAPSMGYPVHYDSITFPVGAWPNHVAQVACYNLLLDSAFPGRTGDSRLLYARDAQAPMRNVMNIMQAKRSVLTIRNAIVSIEYAIINRKFGAFISLLSDESLRQLPAFLQDEALEFRQHFYNLNETERLYVLANVSFILREQYSARIGTDRRLGLASLWQHTIQEKQLLMNAIGYLTIDKEQSDWETLYLVLKTSKYSQQHSAFRKGDIVVLMRHDEQDRIKGWIEGHIFKASIRSIDIDTITVSIRNKQARIDYFTQERQYWSIELDTANDSLFSGMIHSLGDFIRSSQLHRNTLLGYSKPRLNSNIQCTAPDYLHHSQIPLFHAILSSEDYFLLQGPPGTGKTSALIRSIMHALYNNNETILLSAYTNRAVDELCGVLIKSGIPFLRLGSKESTAYPEYTIQFHAKNSTIDHVRTHIKDTRVIVSTVSTLHTHTEIFTLKSFTTAIIDEAAQLLEPQITGILSHVRRFVLIGDERQLPAVVVQDEKGALVNNTLFEDICFTDMRMSLFERLLRLCKKHKWDHAYGMLTVQGRMHTEISTFISNQFYENKLLPMNDWQYDYSQKIIPDYSRLHWIESQAENIPKIHYQEARYAVNLAISLAQSQPDYSIGIIAPFRAQIALMQSMIPADFIEHIVIDTVERFQGSEKDIIIISLAIHSEHQCTMIESLVEFENHVIDRKLNVAITRAKQQCIIIGNPLSLRKDSAYYTLWHILKNKGQVSRND